jgi:hypothetical protein
METPLGVELPGYGITAGIHDSPITAAYRAIRIADELPVVVKLLKPAYASALGISRHGRRVWAASAPGKGAQFSFALHG